MSSSISGVFNILATPFNENKQIDILSLRHLVDFQIEMGAHGLTILGVLGEAPKLTVSERNLVVKTVIETVSGRIPIVVGTSHQETSTCLELSKVAIDAGAAGVMIAPPRMNKPTDEDVIKFYEEVARHINNPIIVQDLPSINNITMTPTMLATLAERVSNARYLKLEDPPIMEKISAIRERTMKYKIFGGLGGMFFLEELKRGASGTMTGFAFTEVLVAIFKAFKDGRLNDAERIFDYYLPLIRYENQPIINLTIRKEILYRRGAIANPALRDPFVPIDSGTHNEITWVLKRVGIEDPSIKLSAEGVTKLN